MLSTIFGSKGHKYLRFRRPATNRPPRWLEDHRNDDRDTAIYSGLRQSVDRRYTRLSARNVARILCGLARTVWRTNRRGSEAFERTAIPSRHLVCRPEAGKYSI